MIRLDAKFRSGILTGAIVACLGFASFGATGISDAADPAVDVVAFSCDFSHAAAPATSALAVDYDLPTLDGVSGPVEVLDDATARTADLKSGPAGGCRVLRSDAQVASIR